MDQRSADEGGQRGFSGAGEADHRDHFTPLQFQADVAQNGPVRLVSEGDVLNLHAALRRCQFDRAGFVQDFGRRLKNFAHTLRAAGRRLQVADVYMTVANGS